MPDLSFQFRPFSGTSCGALTPDDNGYYTVAVGAFNLPNAQGQMVQATIHTLFGEETAMGRRLARGALRGEMGYPRPASDAQNGAVERGAIAMQNFDLEDEARCQWAQRMMVVDEANVCVAVKNVHLVANAELKARFCPEASPEAVLLFADVRPCGPQAEHLDAALRDASVPVSFGMRAFTESSTDAQGTTHHLKNIVCWDWIDTPA